MTLAAIIDAYISRQSERPGLDFVPAAVALTPRGDVNVAVYRLREQLRRLDSSDRAVAAHQLRQVLAELELSAPA